MLRYRAVEAAKSQVARKASAATPETKSAVFRSAVSRKSTAPRSSAPMAIVGAPLADVYLFPAPPRANLATDDATRAGMRREATRSGAQAFVE